MTSRLSAGSHVEWHRLFPVGTCGGFLDVLRTAVCPSYGPLPLHHARPGALGVLHLKYPAGVPDLGWLSWVTVKQP